MASALARVLHVEDQNAVAGLIQLELQQASIRVTTVSGGEQSLAAAHGQRFDLILLDAMLPDLDGLELRDATGHPIARGRRDTPQAEV